MRIHQLSINNTPICCAQLYVDKLFGKRIDDNTFEFSTSDPQLLLDNENFLLNEFKLFEVKSFDNEYQLKYS